MAVRGSDALMQQAAAGVAAAAAADLSRMRGRVYGSRVLILVGPGNNGGDALFAGARLARRGARVTAVAVLGSPHSAGSSALVAAGGRLLGPDGADPATAGAGCDLVIDGVLGIGGRPGLPDQVAAWAASVQAAGTPVLAVDLPSGVAADTGAVPGRAFRAYRTVTFGVVKPCHLVEPGRTYCGEVTLVDIGLAATSASADLVGATPDSVAAAWPYPDHTSDKYSRGVVGADTGSERYPGAAVLGVSGAVHAGAGMVRYLGPEQAATLIRGALPNVVFSSGRVQAYLFGSGWGDRPDGAAVLAEAAQTGLPTVVDADGLTALPDRVPAGWLLTPHAGELAALLGRERAWVSEDPIRAVRAGVERTGATVLLKGATQLVAAPQDSVVRVAVPGPAWTAQAGSGDVLAGVCAALLAAGEAAVDAAVLGASVQALAAAALPGAVPPQRLAAEIGVLLGRLQAPATAERP